ncbi:MAG: response regulator [Butyrivibrio sp.]|nr:response regulator [Butyrivibrio sp.]
MRELLLGMQYLSIIGIFLEGVIIFRHMKTSLHSYLFVSCIAALAANVGYLLELKAVSEDEYITALKFSYAGRIWYAFFLFLFIVRLCDRKIPRAMAAALLLIHALTYCVILNLKNTTLYYTDMRFDTDGIFPKLFHGNGILHHLTMGLVLFYIICGIIMLILSYKKTANMASRRRFLTVMIAVLAEGAFFVAQLIGEKGFAYAFDFTMFGYFFGTLIMLIAILSFDLLGTKELAKEYIIERISEGIIAVDNNGAVKYFNEPIKKLYPDFESRRDAVIASITSAIKNGESITLDDRIFSPELNSLVYEGVDYGKLYVLVDDTDHYRYMEALEKQKEFADKASEAKSRFLASMSHEIRTPISAVLGMDEMILRQATQKSIRAYAYDIMDAGKALLSLIGDILDLSKVEEGKMEIVPVQYELASLINDLVNMVRTRAVKKGLQLNVDVDEHIPEYLEGDEVRIRQCALNLLTNAVKYTESGSVTLNVSYSKKDENSIFLNFRVTDTGIGMRKEDMEALFSPYIRIEEKRNRTIEGTGLGMSITRQLLELMGSTLCVESEYGRGSDFSFSVEQKVISFEEIGDYSGRYNEVREKEYEYRQLFNAPDARILVVDDTEMNHTVITGLLNKTGMRIDCAMSGDDALTLAAVNEYDVIFIDHMMPGMDGIETLERLRELDKNRETPMVALTANAVSGARQMYLDAGFSDYISKPVDGVRLEKMLLSLLPKDKVRLPGDEGDRAVDNKETELSRILVVDDSPEIHELVRSILGQSYNIDVCSLGKEVFSMAKKLSPDLIMLDIYLPDENGFEVMEQLKMDERTSDIPVLLITGDGDSITEENGFKSGAADYIRKPFEPEVLRQRIKRIIDLSHYQRSIEDEVQQQTKKSSRLSREIMLTLSKAVDIKDHYTDGHSRRVAAISAEIARRLGKTPAEQVEQYEIGLLHDIGKIGIHEDIIHKTSRLTDDEFREIKEHTLKGYEILKEIEDMPKLWEGARWHHERFDGTGYPDGLLGTNIPEAARIVCVADCYDAMTSTRTYSTPKRQEDVRAEIVRCSGTWFDPKVADALLSMIDEDVDYHMNEQSDGSDVWKEYERLWKNSSISQTHDAGSAKQELPEWLLKASGLDVDAGIKNCGSSEGYMSVLAVFHQTAAGKSGEIRGFFEAGDLENYTIRVHALKSSARIIGAAALSKLAEGLEKAGKQKDTDFIGANTDRLLDMYRELDEKLLALDEKKEELPDIDDDALADAYNTIIEIADSMDYGLMESIIADLKGYRLKDKDEKNLREIEKRLTELDFEEIGRIARSGLE